MGWLALGVAYSIVYAVIGAYLRPFPDVLPWFRIVALLLPPLVGRRDHRAAPARVGRLPVAVLGDARARPADVGHQRRRLVGRRDAAGRRHVVARMARRVRAVRRRRAAARAAGAAASRSARKSDRDDRRRHRRHRGAHRLPLFTFRRGRRCRSRGQRHIGLAAAAVRASAVSRLRRHGHRRDLHARSANGSRCIGGWRSACRFRSSR